MSLRNLICTVCLKKFQTKAGLISHYKSHVKGPSRIDSSKSALVRNPASVNHNTAKTPTPVAANRITDGLLLSMLTNHCDTFLDHTYAAKRTSKTVDYRTTAITPLDLTSAANRISKTANYRTTATPLDLTSGANRTSKIANYRTIPVKRTIAAHDRNIAIKPKPTPGTTEHRNMTIKAKTALIPVDSRNMAVKPKSTPVAADHHNMPVKPNFFPIFTNHCNTASKPTSAATNFNVPNEPLLHALLQQNNTSFNIIDKNNKNIPANGDPILIDSSDDEDSNKTKPPMLMNNILVQYKGSTFLLNVASSGSVIPNLTNNVVNDPNAKKTTTGNSDTTVIDISDDDTSSSTTKKPNILVTNSTPEITKNLNLGNKNLVCTVCNTTFTDSNNLHEHMKNHKESSVRINVQAILQGHLGEKVSVLKRNSNVANKSNEHIDITSLLGVRNNKIIELVETASTGVENNTNLNTEQPFPLLESCSDSSTNILVTKDICEGNALANTVQECVTSAAKINSEQDAQAITSLSLQCANCTFTTNCDSTLQNHKASVHDKRFKCEKCTDVFMNESMLQLHLETTHKAENLQEKCKSQSNKNVNNTEIEKTFICAICEITFGSSAFETHMKNHFDDFLEKSKNNSKLQKIMEEKLCKKVPVLNGDIKDGQVSSNNTKSIVPEDQVQNPSQVNEETLNTNDSVALTRKSENEAQNDLKANASNDNSTKSPENQDIANVTLENDTLLNNMASFVNLLTLEKEKKDSSNSYITDIPSRPTVSNPNLKTSLENQDVLQTMQQVTEKIVAEVATISKNVLLDKTNNVKAPTEKSINNKDLNGNTKHTEVITLSDSDDDTRDNVDDSHQSENNSKPVQRIPDDKPKEQGDSNQSENNSEPVQRIPDDKPKEQGDSHQSENNSKPVQRIPDKPKEQDLKIDDSRQSENTSRLVRRIPDVKPKDQDLKISHDRTLISNPYKCADCAFSCYAASVLACHRRHLHSSYVCEICNKKYLYIYTLQSHVAMFHKNKVFQMCVKCGFYTMEDDAYKTHMQSHEVKGLPVQHIPFVQIMSVPKIEDKTKTLPDERQEGESDKVAQTTSTGEVKQIDDSFFNTQCSKCEYVSTTVKGLAIHDRLVHGREIKRFCKICKGAFVSVKSLKRHMENHSNYLKCSQCNYRTISKKRMEVHVQTHSEIQVKQEKQSTETEGNQLKCCLSCDYTTNVKKKMKAHVQSHREVQEKQSLPEKLEGVEIKQEVRCEISDIVSENVDNFYCNKCKFTTSSNRNLLEHIKNVHCNEKHACVTCNSKFPTVGALRQHMKIHFFNCIVCKYFTKDKDKLDQHMDDFHLNKHQTRSASTRPSVNTQKADIDSIEELISPSIIYKSMLNAPRITRSKFKNRSVINKQIGITLSTKSNTKTDNHKSPNTIKHSCKNKRRYTKTNNTKTSTKPKIIISSSIFGTEKGPTDEQLANNSVEEPITTNNSEITTDVQLEECINISEEHTVLNSSKVEKENITTNISDPPFDLEKCVEELLAPCKIYKSNLGTNKRKRNESNDSDISKIQKDTLEEKPIIAQFTSIQQSIPKRPIKKLCIQHKCTHCKFSTKSETILKAHLQLHTGKVARECTTCNYKTETKTDLTRHFKIHQGLNKFNCNVCNYSTMFKYKLKLHIVAHTGEKPNACKLCNYYTASKRTLYFHLYAHLVLRKKYKCKFCYYRCKQKRSLLKHMKGGGCAFFS